MDEENTQTHTIIPTFHRKPEESIQNSAMDTHKSLHVFRRSRRRWRTEVVKEVTVKEDVKGTICVVDDKEKEKEKEEEEEEEEEEEDNDREEIERKIHALQRIVPGGESLGVDKLFDETAGYIVSLQYQVKALRTLAGFFEKLDKEKTKFGG